MTSVDCAHHINRVCRMHHAKGLQLFAMSGNSLKSPEVWPAQLHGQRSYWCFAGHATEDTFVGKHHSERLMAAYAGDKNFITFRGDHNSVR